MVLSTNAHKLFSPFSPPALSSIRLSIYLYVTIFFSSFCFSSSFCLCSLRCLCSIRWLQYWHHDLQWDHKWNFVGLGKCNNDPRIVANMGLPIAIHLAVWFLLQILGRQRICGLDLGICQLAGNSWQSLCMLSWISYARVHCEHARKQVIVVHILLRKSSVILHFQIV